MATEYSVWLCDGLGERLFPFGSNFSGLNYTKGVNGLGKLHSFRVQAPDIGTLNELAELVGVDRQLQVWRRPAGGLMGLDLMAFVRYWRWRLGVDGSVELVIEDCPDQNDLLRRRIVAYKSGSAEAIAGGAAADDVMKDVFNENLLAGATDADRQVQGLSVFVEGDESAGPALDKGFSFVRVRDLLEEINEQTRQEGNEIFYGVVVKDVDYATGRLSFEFQTFTGQPGADRTHDSDSPVIFGPAFENVEDMELVYDYRAEENAVYVAGQGVGEERTVVEVEDEGAQGASVWNRVEGFVDARDVENVTMDVDVGANPVLEARGRQRIDETKPRVVVRGRIRSTDYALYGRDWFEGDRVTVNALGVQFDAIVRAVNVQMRGGAERITGYVEAEIEE